MEGERERRRRRRRRRRRTGWVDEGSVLRSSLRSLLEPRG